MFVKSRKLTRLLVLAAVALPLAACGDDVVAPPVFENPSTVTIVNELLGPVLFFRVRACGTTPWSEDLLPNDPVTGTIQPGTQKDVTVEAGCYDFQAQHLPDTSGPGELITKEIENQVASPAAPVTWVLVENPGNPA